MTTPISGSTSSAFPLSPRPQTDAPRPMFSSLAISASGLSAQRIRMDVVAQNLANAETTHTAQGGPYHRRVVTMEAIDPQTSTSSTSSIDPTGATGNGAGTATLDGGDVTGGVRVTSIGEDKTDGPMIYDPGHPDADKNGYVKMPNVNLTDELMDLMNARRIYEANATVFQVARAMLHKAIDI